MSKTGRGANQYMMRFPDGMRDVMHELAKQNGRSVNSEIIIALEKHLASNGLEVPQPKPTGYNQRLDMFIAAALSGLIAKGKPLDELIVRDALDIGQRTLEIVEECE